MLNDFSSLLLYYFLQAVDMELAAVSEALGSVRSKRFVVDYHQCRFLPTTPNLRTFQVFDDSRQRRRHQRQR